MKLGPLENSTRSKILTFLSDKPSGTIFNYEDFCDCGSYTCIRSSIVRVCETGELTRIAQGIFMKSYPDKKQMPSYRVLVNEIARRVHSVAIPYERTENFLKGKTAQKPKILYFATNSATRRITLYDGTVIQFYKRLLSELDKNDNGDK